MTADLTASYEWEPLKIGGGGFVTGIDINPTEQGLIYARTDVGGAYRFQPETRDWTQIVSAETLPDSFRELALDQGVESIASSASDPNVVYMSYRDHVFRSNNRGQSWSVTTLSVPTQANGESRTSGERLAVDPRNSQIVFAGSVNSGLHRSTDGGATWQAIPVSSVPRGLDDWGVTNLVFDPNSDAIQGATSTLYLTVFGQGVFASFDAGMTWSSLSELPDAPNKTQPTDAEVAEDGSLWVTFDSENGSGGIWRYIQDDGWTDASIDNFGFSDIAVDPNNARNAHVFFEDGVSLYTRNFGRSWTWVSGKPNRNADDVDWLDWVAEPWFSTAEVKFDPHAQSDMWIAQGLGVWTTSDTLQTGGITWESVNGNIEEMVSFEVIAPPGGAVVSTVADRSGFRHEDVDAYPTQSIASDRFSTGTSIDYRLADPEFLVLVSANHQNNLASEEYSGYSDDGGTTWKTFGSIENRNHPRELRWGNIAVSASSRDELVWLPSERGIPYSSVDRGDTWQPIELFESVSDGGGHKNLWHHKHALAADTVRSSTFYLYHENDGRIYRSVDAVDDWSATSLRLPQGGTYGQLMPAPGKQGELWFTTGAVGWASDRKLYRVIGADSVDPEKVVVPGVTEVAAIGFGKAADGEDYPTVFIHGKVDGEMAYYRSIDEGETWEKIGDFPNGLLSPATTIAGDLELFGRVYVGIGGNSFVYGDLVSSETVPPTLPGDFNGDGVVGTDDVDLLMSAIRTHSQKSRFDLNEDAVTSDLDLDYMLSHILETQRGDSNLDRQVDFADFLSLSTNFGEHDRTWADGDFNGDGLVSFADFLLLSGNFGRV